MASAPCQMLAPVFLPGCLPEHKFLEHSNYLLPGVLPTTHQQGRRGSHAHLLGPKLLILMVQSMPGTSLNSMQILSLNNQEIKDTEATRNRLHNRDDRLFQVWLRISLARLTPLPFFFLELYFCIVTSWTLPIKNFY